MEVALLTLLFLLFSYTTCGWVIHISMVKDNCRTYGYASYKQFKKHFNNKQWTQYDAFNSSLFSESSESQIHASIIKFDKVGMVIQDPISYLLVTIYIKRYIRKEFRRTHKW